MRRRCRLLVAEQMGNGFAQGKALGGFAELLSLEFTFNPPVENRDHGYSGLEILSPH
jgi:hypothetical protein